MNNLWLKVENIVAKEKLLVLRNFFFYHYVFEKPSAAEASESAYMKERVKRPNNITSVYMEILNDRNISQMLH